MASDITITWENVLHDLSEFQNNENLITQLEAIEDADKFISYSENAQKTILGHLMGSENVSRILLSITKVSEASPGYVLATVVSFVLTIVEYY